MGTASGRWVIAAAVLGSGVAFLDGTVVNAALPAISRDLDANLGDLQWVLTGYLLTLGSLLVLGGSLGDRYGRRKIFVIGLVAFAATSLLCAIAPDTGSLIAARCAQGVAAALLERISYTEDGQPATTTLMDYLAPTAAELCPIEIVHLETPSAFSETGAKGMGEGGTIGAPAAVLNAINDALSGTAVSFDQIPVLPTDLHAALTNTGLANTGLANTGLAGTRTDAP